MGATAALNAKFNILPIKKINEKNMPEINIYNEIRIGEEEIRQNKIKNAFSALEDLKLKYDL